MECLKCGSVKSADNAATQTIVFVSGAAVQDKKLKGYKMKSYGRKFTYKGNKYYTGGFPTKEALEIAIKKIKRGIDKN